MKKTAISLLCFAISGCTTENKSIRTESYEIKTTPAIEELRSNAGGTPESHQEPNNDSQGKKIENQEEIYNTTCEDLGTCEYQDTTDITAPINYSNKPQTSHSKPGSVSRGFDTFEGKADIHK